MRSMFPFSTLSLRKWSTVFLATLMVLML
jgi:hypothetical protein